MQLLRQVHGAVRFSENFFGRLAVGGIGCLSDAHGKTRCRGALVPRFLDGGADQGDSLVDIGGAQSGQNHHKLIASHARDIVILAARVFQAPRNVSQDLIPFQVAEGIVDWFKGIQIADQNGDRPGFTPGARDFAVQVKEQRAGVRQSGKKVRGCGVLDLLQVKRVLERKGHLG